MPKVTQTAWERFKAGAAQIDAPLQVGNPDEFNWDDSVDIAVLGFGGAGAAAAIEARDAGADVAVVERFNGGGSTKISGGILYAGGGTRIQRDASVEDSPENMYNYLVREAADAVCENTLRHFCEDSAENLDWLMEQGVPFQASLCPFKTSYPSNQYYLYYSGNEAFPPYTDTAKPAARGHRAHGKGVSGAALFEPLREAAQRKGVKILTQNCALGLITGTKGEVLGIRLARLQAKSLSGWLHRKLYDLLIFSRYASMYVPVITWVLRAALKKLESSYSETLNLRATRGVIISTGGFFYNRDMVEEYAPRHLPGMPLGTIGDDGSGILLGESVGGETGLMENVSQWRFVNPPESFIKGVLVDMRGQRICNEMLYGAQLGEQIQEKADGDAWLILDARLIKRAMREIGPSRAMWFQSATALMYLLVARKKAGSLSALADKIGIPASALQETLRQYNSDAKSGKDDPLGKPASHRQLLEEGPWYALDCRVTGIVRNPSITLGGLRVDQTTGEVLSASGGKVGGLYAAGRSAVGIASHSYVSGLSIAGCVFSGRRAGRHAAGG
ncbi:MAG: FAD-binding protein [Halioglobus sp.]